MKETAVIMNMCRVTDAQGRWLMQERNDEDYPGAIFPGGHVESGESFSEAVIREVEEETGITVINPKLEGVKHWTEHDGIHYIILMYSATEYTGTLQSSDEGRVFWATPEEVKNMETVADFYDNLDIFDNKNVREVFFRPTTDDWEKILLD